MGILDARQLPRSDYDLVTGESVMSRELATAASNGTASQRLMLSFFRAKKTETTTQVKVWSGSTAAAATPTLCRVGLYSVDANWAITQVAATVNDTSLFASTNTAYTKAWAVPYAKQAGAWYAVGILVVTGAATPTFLGQTLASSAIPLEMYQTPPLCAIINSQADLPAGPVAYASLSSTTVRIYSAVLP